MKTYIYADKFFMNYGIEENGYFPLIDGKFGHFRKKNLESAEIVDFSGKYIAPGFVDTHIHGLLNSRCYGQHSRSNKNYIKRTSTVWCN